MNRKTSQHTDSGTFAALVNRINEIEPLLEHERFIVNDIDGIDKHLIRWLKHKGVVFVADMVQRTTENGKNRQYKVWEWKQDIRRELKEYRESLNVFDCGHRPHVYHHPDKDCLTCKFCAEKDNYPEYSKDEVSNHL